MSGVVNFTKTVKFRQTTYWSFTGIFGDTISRTYDAQCFRVLYVFYMEISVAAAALRYRTDLTYELCVIYLVMCSSYISSKNEIMVI